ncbi:Lipid-A-disaccharide synthase [Nitrospina gracilis 3/211]|uniref:Lipid-A-disaccharide synthase n=1 Tax=Nitrospina gracilis (strain 3/211) TaxID=1266370 RepID=M1YVQ1_NITG3|nr:MULTISPECIES: lipid-A-disaccharide synthase [Nitrospina]MCF8722626.1 lipid-A-disaccharide synthase [Nitrospina sp. Nb-3]CCQ89555.1 Lipid-A-disaccharide synthase [Nitrospina gracilis 3/211]
MNGSSQRILIVAGEASGDLHGGNLVRAMQERHPKIEFEGVGGHHMQNAGVRTLFDIQRMGGMGLFEFFSNLWHHISVFRKLSREIAKGQYAGAILINYPFFNLRLARVCKKYHCPVYYYISPQVWASRKGRIHTIAQTGKKMYVILPFEKDIYREVDVDVEYLGHPFVDIAKPHLSKEDAFREFGLDPSKTTVGLMPGSRMSEINYLLDDILGAARILKDKLGDVQFLLPVADSIDTDLLRERLGNNPLDIRLVTGRNYEVMAGSDFLIMASGSATLEAGLLECPMVIIYKVHPLTYFIARFFTDIRLFGLVNIVAEEQVATELLNEQVTPEAIADEALKVLNDPKRAAEFRQRLKDVRRSLGEPGVVDRIAKNILDSLNLPSSTADEKVSL